MYQKSEFEVEICDSVIDIDDSGKSLIYVKNPNSDKPLYKVSIYLAGDDLPYVESVEYELHKTFKDRFKSVQRTLSNPNCTMTIWTWGIFEIKAVVTTKDGSTFHLSHHLTYGNQIAHEKYELIPS